MDQTLKSTSQPRKRSKLLVRITKHWPFYLFILPAFVWYGIFSYYPMTGLALAFQKYSLTGGYFNNQWVGLRYFNDFLRDPKFWQVVRNTLNISVFRMMICFPAPIVLALMLNSVYNKAFKRTVQTISYLPHFISWVVVAALIHRIFSPTVGLINDIRYQMGLDTIYFLGIRENWIPFMVLSDMWKGIGYGSIIYLAALTGIDPTLYEASSIDGANGAQKLWHITLPGIKHTVGILFLLQIGSLFSVNFEQVLLLQQPSTITVSEVIDTYVLRRAFQMNQMDYATALGMFRSVMALLLVISANYASKKFTEISIW
ncbi:MAG: ABC transporter permease subunit [Oscillospiraceae bacterium]|nr:ABC transporter permease subunit [Oscillospiraceae bacterium]